MYNFITEVRASSFCGTCKSSILNKKFPERLWDSLEIIIWVDYNMLVF